MLPCHLPLPHEILRKDARFARMMEFQLVRFYGRICRSVLPYGIYSPTPKLCLAPQNCQAHTIPINCQEDLMITPNGFEVRTFLTRQISITTCSHFFIIKDFFISKGVLPGFHLYQTDQRRELFC